MIVQNIILKSFQTGEYEAAVNITGQLQEKHEETSVQTKQLNQIHNTTQE